MDTNRPDGLVVDEVRWEEEPGGGWLFRQVFDLLLRNPARAGPDLTDVDTSSTVQSETVEEEGGDQ